ncbi:hypothetical protein Hoch_5529 [Haliangium ochraceum DSM 14365]|uniref:Uncharacterized protein n=2 Tax=Haliangium ochraceum TaxID=80816 RepID=D0LZN3_HALO1|nr:hypothetical protein Hoch_5529 [Haliangium ochraceum DSM 14365]
MALALLSTGCHVYLGGDDDGGSGVDAGPPICDMPPPPPPLLLVNPETGECEDFSSGGFYCDPVTCECFPTPGAPPPSWAPCSSSCTGLGELACLEQSGCRAAYRQDDFRACFAVDTQGPVQGVCEGFDAWACSTRDDCIARHSGSYDAVPLADAPSDAAAALIPPLAPLGFFESCEQEPTRCDDDANCGPGEYCEISSGGCPPEPCDPDDPRCDGFCGGVCTPNQGQCFAEVDCAAAPPQCSLGSVPEVSNGCWTGACVFTDDCPRAPFEQCYGEPTCDVPPPSCPSDQMPQIVNGCWTGACIPAELCQGEPVEGSCYGRFTCDEDAPECPEGRVPGLADGCWTGSCISLDACGPVPAGHSCSSPASCESLPPPCPSEYVPLIDGDSLCWSGVCAPPATCAAAS